MKKMMLFCLVSAVWTRIALLPCVPNRIKGSLRYEEELKLKFSWETQKNCTQFFELLKNETGEVLSSTALVGTEIKVQNSSKYYFEVEEGAQTKYFFRCGSHEAFSPIHHLKLPNNSQNPAFSIFILPTRPLIELTSTDVKKEKENLGTHITQQIKKENNSALVVDLNCRSTRCDTDSSLSQVAFFQTLPSDNQSYSIAFPDLCLVLHFPSFLDFEENWNESLKNLKAFLDLYDAPNRIVFQRSLLRMQNKINYLYKVHNVKAVIYETSELVENPSYENPAYLQILQLNGSDLPQNQVYGKITVFNQIHCIFELVKKENKVISSVLLFFPAQRSMTETIFMLLVVIIGFSLAGYLCDSILSCYLIDPILKENSQRSSEKRLKEEDKQSLSSEIHV